MRRDAAPPRPAGRGSSRPGGRRPGRADPITPAPAPDRPALSARLRLVLADAARVLRRIVGAPDYRTYVAAVHTRDPGVRPMTEVEFRADRLRSRYDRPGSRCC